jgi:hypothetical protein
MRLFMKLKQEDVADRARRIIRMFLGAAVLGGLILLIAVQTRSSENPQLQMLEFAAFIFFIVGFAVILGVAYLRLVNGDIALSKNKRDEVLMTDDGEIIEVVDDEKRKGGADSMVK